MSRKPTYAGGYIIETQFQIAMIIALAVLSMLVMAALVLLPR